MLRNRTRLVLLYLSFTTYTVHSLCQAKVLNKLKQLDKNIVLLSLVLLFAQRFVFRRDRRHFLWTNSYFVQSTTVVLELILFQQLFSMLRCLVFWNSSSYLRVQVMSMAMLVAVSANYIRGYLLTWPWPWHERMEVMAACPSCLRALNRLHHENLIHQLLCVHHNVHMLGLHRPRNNVPEKFRKSDNAEVSWLCSIIN